MPLLFLFVLKLQPISPLPVARDSFCQRLCVTVTEITQNLIAIHFELGFTLEW